MAKQIKGNGTEWKGKAFRHGLFFLSLSLYPSLSFSLYLVFLHVKRLEPNNEIACVPFSFPGSGFACFDGIFGLFVGGRGAQLQRLVSYLRQQTNILGDGVERVFV